MITLRSFNRSLVHCTICGSEITNSRPYLGVGGENAARDLAYLLPTPIIRGLMASNLGLHDKARAVFVNKQFFGDKTLFWCDSCCFGFAWPLFDKTSLDSYYRDFYWTSREHHSVYFGKNFRPRDENLVAAQARLDWLDKHGVTYSSAIDFGAGDCAAAYLMSKRCGERNVHVVDSSEHAKVIAAAIGVSFSKSLINTSSVDFIYSSHTIEHVADLFETLSLLASVLTGGGIIFLETPNIADRQVFTGLVMTPHTFLLSALSFERLCEFTNLELIAAESVGPEWRERHKVASPARADLRVLLRKSSP